LNALQKFDLLRCSNLKKLHSSLSKWIYSKNLICQGGAIEKKYLHLLTNQCTPKNLICQGVTTWKNYLHLLVNWMHYKSFIYKTSPTWKDCEKCTFIYGQIGCI
jgi:hypothetical protein